MAAFLERTQKLRQHIEALIRRDAAKRSLAVDGERCGAAWTTEVVEAAQKKQGDGKRCVCIGLSCPQGGGKTTASMYMQEALALMGKKCAVMSLDDVYWKYEQQVALAKATQPIHCFRCAYRGNPGTMDVPLLMDVVHECKTSTGEIALPRYDKSQHNGRGDRVPVSDVHMKAVNKELRALDKFYEELDGLVVIKIDNLDWVYEWREQPEQLLREAKKPAMTPDEVRDFVDRFMPAYKTYLKELYAADPKESTSPLAKVPRLIFSITSAREPAGKPMEFNFTSEALKD
ncbi:P-loop containing nucleoside triphosphate hydrolase [Phytophthora cactorum]|nr:P-loop containing nucleoside triphosphate hydrolase [Phytophthora cactorum]